MDLKERYIELSQEYANYRQRTIKEKEELKHSGCKDLLSAILPAIDDMERTIANSDSDCQSFKQGVFLSYVNLIKGLKSQGVEVMRTKHQSFNPELHEAVGTVRDGEKNNIFKCVRHGYLLNGDVVRHAQVIVSN